jgi:hypothetical protein
VDVLYQRRHHFLEAGILAIRHAVDDGLGNFNGFELRHDCSVSLMARVGFARAGTRKR